MLLEGTQARNRTVARYKLFHLTIELVNMSGDATNVAAIDMDTDGSLIRKSIPHFVHISQAWRNGLHITRQEL